MQDRSGRTVLVPVRTPGSSISLDPSRAATPPPPPLTSLQGTGTCHHASLPGDLIYRSSPATLLCARVPPSTPPLGAAVPHRWLQTIPLLVGT